MNSDNEILKQVNDVFKDVLENDDLVIEETTTAGDVGEWDSLSHILLIVSIEKHFKIRFTSSEINGFANVGEMCDGIAKKIAAK